MVCNWIVFACFAPATVNISAKKCLVEALFTCAPVFANGALELKCLFVVSLDALLNTIPPSLWDRQLSGPSGLPVIMTQSRETKN